MEPRLTIFNTRGTRYIIDEAVLSKLEYEFYEAVQKNSLVSIDAQGKVEIINKEAE